MHMKGRINETEMKERGTWSSAHLLSPLVPVVYTHLLIQMPQTYTVSPGGDTADPSATCSHLTPQHCDAVISTRCAWLAC